MKVMITGAQGQLGQALAKSAPQGTVLVASDLADLNLADPADVHARVHAEMPDWVINCAAYTAVDKAESEPDVARAINAGAVSCLAQALSATGGRLAQISTDFVFDGKASQPYQADARRGPLSVYGQTKAAGEDAAGEDALIIRTSWLYAAGGANFVTTMLRLMREREELRVVSDQIGAPTWAPGLARVIWTLVEAGKSGIFHHCDAGQASWHDFAVAIQEEALALDMLDQPIPIYPCTTSEYPTPARRPAFSLLDCSATRAIPGCEAAPWRNNLRAMLKEQKALG